MVKYLLLGKNGQLGKEFLKTFENKNIIFKAVSRVECDVSNFNQVFKIFNDFKPDIVINCTAYNKVDNAEWEYFEAFKSNSLAVENLINLCRDYNSFLIHYSTDYVFDGLKNGLYTEEDLPNPVNMYGKSKLIGEKLLLENDYKKFLLLRVSWVYGEGKQNFLYKLSQWAQSQDYLKVACDEVSVPTSTKTIVKITLKAIEKELTGLYHLVNSGYTSRFEWALEYFRLSGIKKFIYPAYQSDFNLPAKRPKFSAMSNEKISKDINIEIKHWKDELKDIVNFLSK